MTVHEYYSHIRDIKGIMVKYLKYEVLFMNKKILSFSAVLFAVGALVSCGKSGDSASKVVPRVTAEETAAESDNKTDAAEQSADGAAASVSADGEPEPETETFYEDVEPAAAYVPLGSSIIDGFETVLQRPELPTGCEVTALTETLNFLGFDVDKEYLFDNYMPVDYAGTYTMNNAYIGDPRSETGFGCYAPVVVKTADDYFRDIDSPCYAVNISETSFRDLFYQIDCGRPVIVWTTMDLYVSYPKYVYTAANGEEMWFDYYQHCLAVYGYDTDQNIVYAADPLKGNVTYSIDSFETVYDIMGQQAVVICGDSTVQGSFSELNSYEEFDSPGTNAQQSINEEH